MNSPETFGRPKASRIARAVKQIESATRQEFYLEAITICESLVTDRLLASRERKLGRERSAKKSLGRLLEEHERAANQGTMAGPQLPDDLLNKLKDWKDDRNELLHSIAKCLPGKEIEHWDSVMQRARLAADRGLLLFRELDKVVRRKASGGED